MLLCYNSCSMSDMTNSINPELTAALENERPANVQPEKFLPTVPLDAVVARSRVIEPADPVVVAAGHYANIAQELDQQ